MKKLWSSSPVLFLREALLLYFSRRVPQAAASLAYFVLLTVFPVLICVSYLLGLVNIDVVSLIDQLQTVFPEAALDVVESYLVYISSHQSIGLFFAGLAAGWFSAAAAFRTVTQVIVDMYDEVSQSMLPGLVSSILFAPGAAGDGEPVGDGGGHRPANPGGGGPAPALPVPGGGPVVLDPVCAAVLHLLSVLDGGAELGGPLRHPSAAHAGEQLGLRPGAGGVFGGVLLVHWPVHPAVAGVWVVGVSDHSAAMAVPVRADPVFGDCVYQCVVPAAKKINSPIPEKTPPSRCSIWGVRGFSSGFLDWADGIMYHYYGILALVALGAAGTGGVAMRQQSFQKALSKMTETGFRLFFVASLLFAGLTACYNRWLCLAELVLVLILYLYFQTGITRRKKEVMVYLDHMTSGVDAASRRTMITSPLPL